MTWGKSKKYIYLLPIIKEEHCSILKFRVPTLSLHHILRGDIINRCTTKPLFYKSNYSF